MKSKAVFLAGVLALALGGCDRSDQRPASTAAQDRSTGPALRADADGPPNASRPQQDNQAPRPDGNTQAEPPVQGQADTRQSEQAQQFDNKK